MTTPTTAAIAAIERALEQCDSEMKLWPQLAAIGKFQATCDPEALRLILAALRGAQEDAARLNHLQEWADENRRDGLKWATFSFAFEEDSGTVREQLDADRQQEKSHG